MKSILPLLLFIIILPVFIFTQDTDKIKKELKRRIEVRDSLMIKRIEEFISDDKLYNNLFILNQEDKNILEMLKDTAGAE